MLTALETRFMERMPIILTDLTKSVESLSNLTKAVENLTKEVAELNKELKIAKEMKSAKSE